MRHRLTPPAHRKLSTALIATAFLTALTVAQVMAQAPDSLSFQGKLTDTGGTPLNTTVSMTFKLYKNGSDVWTETQPSVQVTDGVFNVLLGSVTPLDTIAFDQPIELGIKVGTDDEITPRTPLAAGAFALGVRGMHAEMVENDLGRTYNIIGGWLNSVAPGVVGATIAGGISNLESASPAAAMIPADEPPPRQRSSLVFGV